MLKCDRCGKHYLKWPCPHCGYYISARPFRIGDEKIWLCTCLRCGAMYVYDPATRELAETQIEINLPDIPEDFLDA